MYKDRDKKKKHNSNNSNFGIDIQVDRILSKYHHKFNQNDEKGLDVERFSLTNKNGKSIYFVKTKQKGKPGSDTLSNKIISEARSNLGEEPVEIDEIEKSIDNNFEDIKVKKHIKLGKKTTIRNKDLGDKNKDFEGFTEKKIKPIKIDKADIFEGSQIDGEEARLVEEKIKKSPETKNIKNPDKQLESEALNLAEKHNLFSKDGEYEKLTKDKDEIVGKSLFDKEQKDINFSNINGKKDTEIIDKNLSNNSLDEPKVQESGKSTLKDVADSVEKKSFFKKAKDPKENFAKREEPVDSSDSYSGFKFRVENLPAKEIDAGEIKKVDEGIKNLPETKNAKPIDGVAEKQAMSLAKEHLKHNDDTKPNFEKDSFRPLEVKSKDDEEHVFFDEEENSFGGWAPKISDADKKKMSMPLEAKSELDGDFKLDKDIELPKEALQANSVKLTDLGFSENEWEELDFYSLQEPFSYVEILRDRESLDKCYFLVEVELPEQDRRALEFIQETMNQLKIDTIELDARGGEKYLHEQVDQIIDEYNLDVGAESKNKILYYLEKRSLGLGKISPILKDPNIEDISCDGSGVPLFLYHRKYGSLKSNIKFGDEDELSSFIFRLAQKCGKHISIAEPMLDATMPDGSRVQMTLSEEITAKGSTFTIRKFREDPFSPPDLVEFNTMSSEMVAYMWMAVENGVNTLFAGGTASGKTTALNALILFVPRESKIVSIEETREINLPHPNWIPGVARSGFGEVVANNKMIGEIDMYDLMKAALRQRPEYIIVGEIRGREAYVLFQAMATGHATYSTVHADSAQSLIHRLEGKPINIPRVMLQSLDIICLHVITRVKNNRARRCKQIIEIIDIDPTTKEILTNEVFRWDPVEDKFIYSGKSYILERIRSEKDMSREQMTNEIKNRKKVIDWMNETNIREFTEVARLLSQYVEAPEDTLMQIEKKEVKK